MYIRSISDSVARIPIRPVQLTPRIEEIRPEGRTAPAVRPESSGERIPEDAIQLLKPFFPRLNLRRVRVDDLSEYSQWLVNQAGADAITIGTTIYVRKGEYDPNTVGGLVLLGHELTHVQQYQDRGRIGFFWRYGTDYLRGRLTYKLDHGDAYREIRDEREAQQMEVLIRSYLLGKIPSQFSAVG